jgi:hypothetical protein
LNRLREKLKTRANGMPAATRRALASLVFFSPGQRASKTILSGFYFPASPLQHSPGPLQIACNAELAIRSVLFSPGS